MLDKLYSGLSVFAIATVLSTGGFVGVLFMSGKLSGEKMAEIRKVLRGESLTPASRPASQPTSAPAEGEHEAPATKPHGADFEARRSQERLQKAELERARRDVLAQRDLVDQAMQRLISETEHFDAQRNAWSEQQKRMRDTSADEGFQRELEYTRKLAPAQAKDHLLKVWAKDKDQAVRLLTAMKTSEGNRILEQLKTPQELDTLHELLERLGKQESDTITPESRKTPAAEKP